MDGLNISLYTFGQLGGSVLMYIASSKNYADGVMYLVIIISEWSNNHII